MSINGTCKQAEKRIRNDGGVLAMKAILMGAHPEVAHRLMIAAANQWAVWRRGGGEPMEQAVSDRTENV